MFAIVDMGRWPVEGLEVSKTVWAESESAVAVLCEFTIPVNCITGRPVSTTANRNSGNCGFLVLLKSLEGLQSVSKFDAPKREEGRMASYESEA